MRLIQLALALISTLAAGSASASHLFITGLIEDRPVPVRANRSDCEGDTEYLFHWNVIVQGNILLNDIDMEIRSTTRRGTACQFGSTSDNCTVRMESQKWDKVTLIRQSYTVRSFFEGENNDGCTGEGVRAASLFLRDNTPNLFTGVTEPAVEGRIEFQFDFEPPPVPVAPTLVPGSEGIRVVFPAQPDGGAAIRHRAWWSLDPATLRGHPACSGDYRTSCQSGPTIATADYRIGGLRNGETVYVAISAIDDFDNESEVSEAVSEVPIPISDFFQYYTDAGGEERGGHCFVATAAYGSSIHPLVASLRRFRDRVLVKTELGRAIVDFYRLWSPAMAEVVADTPVLKIAARVVLLPIAALAWFVVDTVWWEKIGLLLALWVAWRVLRAARRRWRRAFAAGAALCLLGVANPASADSPRNFYFELKFGGISPGVDDRPAPVSTVKPYESTFGGGTLFTGGFELEWQILKNVGSFGVSYGMLFFQAVGKGIRPDTGERASETTVLNVLPLQMNAVYRMDIPMRRWSVPLVPYAKFGVDYYIWWVLNGAGNVATATDAAGTTRRGSGGTIGLHFTLGLQIQLDAIDRRMQKAFDEDVGINHSYLFAEIVFSRVDDFNQRSLNFSSIYFLAGLALEF